MARYKLIIEYDGTGLVGWQRQKEDLSLQEILEDAIYSLTSERAEAVASGRTDAGVHAFGQVVHFDLDKDFDEYKVLTGLNHYLIGKPISIIFAQQVDNDFHARFDAKKRYYRYVILNRISPSVLDKNRCWHITAKLDLPSMKQAANHLLGNHDFSSFRASECQAKTPVKTLDSIEITQNGEKICFDISARSFLHHQCRNIVGTLKEVGEGRIQPDCIKAIIGAKNRSAAGITAPAHGLYFVKVDYGLMVL